MEGKEAKREATRSRQPFTPGWSDDLHEADGLPIKKGNKVFKVKKAIIKQSKQQQEQEDNEVIIHDDGDEEDEPDQEAAEGEGGENGGVEDSQAAAVVKAVEVVAVHLLNRSPAEEIELKQRLADICTSITANPETAILRGKGDRAGSGLPQEDQEYTMKDLLTLISSREVMECELAMQSATLVFKDICPSYRIRSDAKDSLESHQQLKKETKRLHDYEVALLKAYERFLRLLEKQVVEGLGSIKHPLKPSFDLNQRLAMVALRCQCELFKTLNQFNLRSNLLTTLLHRGAQENAEEVTELCASTLEEVVHRDQQGDLSFELVTTMSKLLTTTKFHIPPRLLRALQAIRLTVHEDKVKALQIQVKSARKKRKRKDDPVEAMMMEANMEADKMSKLRFQGNALQEIALIYFRILKAKIGFVLLPVALEGLGKITHLINLDTVMDLLGHLRNLLELQPSPPLEVRCLSIHCALQTLTGAGEVLKMDDNVYLLHLQAVMREVPVTFQYWQQLLECIEMSLLKRRIESLEIVLTFVRLLLINALHHLDGIADILLAMMHNVLLRYPRLRQRMLEQWSLLLTTKSGSNNKSQPMVEEEDKVEDLAMQGLRDGTSIIDRLGQRTTEEENLGDGSFALAVIKGYPDRKYSRIVDIIISKEIAPLPCQPSDVRKRTAFSLAEDDDEEKDVEDTKHGQRRKGYAAKKRKTEYAQAHSQKGKKKGKGGPGQKSGGGNKKQRK